MMEFWFISNDGKTKLRLPVPPPEFMDDTGHNIPIDEINDFGEYSRRGFAKLERIVIKSFFPAIHYSFCQYKNYPKPYDCVKIIKSLKNGSSPVRLLITNTDLNKLFYIESFRYGERAGSRDVDFEAELVEYRSLPPATTTSPTAPASNNRGTETKQKAKTYTVKSGDTLWDIARRFYQNPYKWTDIAKANNIKDPKKLQIGKVLRLP
jgi:LysM domain